MRFRLKKNNYNKVLSVLLSMGMAMMGCILHAPLNAYASSYVNTNLNTFIHDPEDLQTGYPGEDMQIHVRIGYNGVNGLYNPPTEEIENIRVRLSNDQSYLADNKGPATYQKNNPYKDSSDEDSGEADAWEEGYQKGKQNAYKTESNYYYELVGGVYPFEVNASLFTQEQQKDSLKVGEYLDLTFNVTVRSDALKMKDSEGNTSDGYFGIPFTIWYEIPQNSTGYSGKFSNTEFINVFITEPGEIGNPVNQTRDQAFVIGENQETPAGVYPNVMNYGVNFRNQSGKTLYDVVVKLDTNLAEKESVQLTANPKAEATRDFPFNINEANYDRNYEQIAPEETINVPYSMAIKQNTASGFYPLHYTVSYKRAPGAGVSSQEEYTFFVNIRNASMIDTESTRGEFNENDRIKARLIVDSYSTEPEKVYAGEPFKLILNMKNASSSISASNILFSLSSVKANDAPVFNMEGGSNSIVVNSLGAGETIQLSVNMTAAAGVDPKSYAITIEEKYDSPEYKNASEKVDIDIPVNQNARLSVSNFEITPEYVEVGGDANVMFGINNTGKVILYNVEAILEAPSIKTTSTYLGNIEPGKTGNVDVMVSAVEASMDDGKIPVTIRYEDVNGNPSEEQTEITLFVTDPAPMDFDMDGMGEFEESDNSLGVLPKIGIAAGICACLGIAGVILVRVRKKKKQAEKGEDEII